MSEASSNNKRIAKNTLLLYFRMGIIMLVQLYTSRVILQQLGIEDYGIYNVVGGVVAMFGFFNSAMTSSTSRYITFALGMGDKENQNHVFCTSINIHAMISLLVLFLAETIGLWYIYTNLVVAPERFNAAIWVYQISVVSTIVLIMSVPYNSSIIAHERMSAFAYVSVIEVVLKLLVVYLLSLAPFDKLIFYAVLILLVQILIRFCYTIYCNQQFKECHYHFSWDKKLTAEMSSFALWSFWGNFAAVTYTQGLNLLLNVFFGPVVNAARAISVQVQNAMTQFVTNFQMALNPQITKQYACGEMDSMYNLMYRSARFSFYLLMILAIPIQLEAPRILSIWLDIIPDNTVTFLRIMLCVGLVYTLSNPLIILAQATGKVRKYQSIAGGVLLFIIPISYVCLLLGLHAYTVFVVHFFVELVDLFVRMYLLRDMCGLSISKYIKKVCIVVARVAFYAYLPSISIYLLLPKSLTNSIVVIALSIIFSSVAIYAVGLTKRERQLIVVKIKQSWQAKTQYEKKKLKRLH